MVAVVIVDMQNDFIDGVLGSPEARSVVPVMVKRLKELTEKNDHPYVILTQDTHGENYLSTQEGRNLPVPHCIQGTEGHNINKDIVKAVQDFEFANPGGEVIRKFTFGSFDLATRLYQKTLQENFPLEEIILMGVCTDICVVSNAMILKALMPEVKISVDASCCAGVTPEKHKAALETMRSCQINIINEV